MYMRYILTDFDTCPLNSYWNIEKKGHVACVKYNHVTCTGFYTSTKILNLLIKYIVISNMIFIIKRLQNTGTVNYK